VTVLESRPETQPVKAEEAPKVASAKPPRSRTSTRASFSIAVIALVAVVAGWALFELFEGPIAQSWYRTRQHQLSAQLAESRPHTGRGAAIAVLQAPNVGLNVVVAEGDSPQQLRSGPGHRAGTPAPGDIGNSVIVGHRTGWGGAFRSAADLQTGQDIVVQTADPPRNAFFKIISIRRVGANDPTPFAQTTDRRLTIVTGTGGQFSDQRLVITAVSGKVGKVRPSDTAAVTATPAGSRLWNASMLLAVMGIAAGCLIALMLRRRYRLPVVAAVAIPLLALGVLGLFMNLDLFLPPLR
jgi:LPXTG-site transpeptidase (sortase) family protein